MFLAAAFSASLLLMFFKFHWLLNTLQCMYTRMSQNNIFYAQVFSILLCPRVPKARKIKREPLKVVVAFGLLKISGCERSGERHSRWKYAVWYGLLRCSGCERTGERDTSWISAVGFGLLNVSGSEVYKRNRQILPLLLSWLQVSEVSRKKYKKYSSSANTDIAHMDSK